MKPWHAQEEVVLKRWAEVSACYRWMHDKAYRVYKTRSIGFALPVIVMSTITGTANFAQKSFPENSFVPMGIGTMNLVSAIITTVSQFLKINELMEGFRVGGIAFGKLNRAIVTELSLPLADRSTSGVEFVKACRADIDRLIEQSPPIPRRVIARFERTFPDSNVAEKAFARPAIMSIDPVEPFNQSVAASQTQPLAEDL